MEYEADILARGEAAQLAAHEEAQREIHADHVAAQMAHEEGERMAQDEAQREMFADYVERERARSDAAQYAAHEAEQAEQFEFFEERAAFFEFDAGFMRTFANAAAGRLFEPGAPGGYWLPLPERPQPERTRIELASTEREQRKLETTWSPTGPAG